jgi:hypothetical protein
MSHELALSGSSKDMQVIELQQQIRKLRKCVDTIKDPHKEAKQKYYKIHKDDENIIADIRQRLIQVNLYTHDKAIPWQLIKMATDWKYDIERGGEDRK